MADRERNETEGLRDALEGLPIGGQTAHVEEDGTVVFVDKPQPETWEFTTQEERDGFIDERFPERQMDEVPGGYRLPDGSYLGVLANRVTHYPREEN